MRNAAALLIVTTLMAVPTAGEERPGQGSPSASSGKARVIGTIIGAAGGFVLGIFAGLTWFDDAVNSDRKVWTTAAGFAAAGGVGGYFIGRAVGSPSVNGNMTRPYRSADRMPTAALPPMWPALRPLPSSASSAQPADRAFRRLFQADRRSPAGTGSPRPSTEDAGRPARSRP